MSKRILILGGTGEARMLAVHLNELGFDVISSLAGRTDNPTLPDGETRIGGFGGIEGLRDYLVEQKIDLLIDATHPFAARISSNAYEATKQAQIEIIRLERQPWEAEEGDIWHHVQSLEDAVTALPKNCTALVTIGRQQLGSFLDRDDVKVIARAIEAPSITVPDRWKIILARPPFSLYDEIELVRSHNIDVAADKFNFII